eukprot:CAMPEP_0184483604 /NCGR_PEP_ID=MMETSP0113_2-20130426/5293_1 /TAXON_ID=91329 /ORGANISM="Norrisiella sphaerica, Strain BC52" /LENGTH=269 /DNA_ID=CAMNT_0026864137 /DNA_START=181 /DNA_END=990 /DNA_ORIENTATION=-
MQILQSSEEVKKRERRISSVRDLMHQAEDMLETGQYEDAISLYDKAIKKEKSLLTLVTGKAQAEIKAGKLEAAIKTYSRAMEMSPNNATVLFNRGVVYQKMGNLKEAIKDYSRSAEILPGNQKVHFNCSLALKKLGHFEEALDEIDIALEIDPQSTDALFNKANILMKLKEFKKAVEVLEKATEIDPRDEELREKLASVKEEEKVWILAEPERRKKREEKYNNGKSQLHGYYNRKSKANARPQISTGIRVCKLTPETMQPGAQVSKSTN